MRVRDITARPGHQQNFDEKIKVMTEATQKNKKPGQTGHSPAGVVKYAFNEPKSIMPYQGAQERFRQARRERNQDAPVPSESAGGLDRRLLERVPGDA